MATIVSQSVVRAWRRRFTRTQLGRREKMSIETRGRRFTKVDEDTPDHVPTLRLSCRARESRRRARCGTGVDGSREGSCGRLEKMSIETRGQRFITHRAVSLQTVLYIQNGAPDKRRFDQRTGVHRALRKAREVQRKRGRN